MIQAALLALQFLTRAPVTLSGAPDARTQGIAVLFFPLIGILIGLTLAGLSLLLPATTPLLNAALLLAVWVFISGALHLDGLADCADAWIGGHGDRERSLRILEDPASGPVAVSVVVCVLLIKFAALSSIATNAGALLLIPPLTGRALLVAALRFTPYVRRHGLGESMARELPPNAAIVVIAASALLIAWLGSAWTTVAAMLVYLGVIRAAHRCLGGITGDVAGALCELGEASALVTLALFSHGQSNVGL